MPPLINKWHGFTILLRTGAGAFNPHPHPNPPPTVKHTLKVSKKSLFNSITSMDQQTHRWMSANRKTEMAVWNHYSTSNLPGRFKNYRNIMRFYMWNLQIIIFLDLFSEFKKKILEPEICCFRKPQNAWNTLYIKLVKIGFKNPPFFTPRLYEAGYRATKVACGWTGVIFEVTRPIGQEQSGQKNKIKKK